STRRGGSILGRTMSPLPRMLVATVSMIGFGWVVAPEVRGQGTPPPTSSPPLDNAGSAPGPGGAPAPAPRPAPKREPPRPAARPPPPPPGARPLAAAPRATTTGAPSSPYYAPPPPAAAVEAPLPVRHARERPPELDHQHQTGLSLMPGMGYRVIVPY